MDGQSNVIEERAAWTSKAIGGKEGLVYRFTPEHLAAFHALLEKTRSKRCEDITRADFDHPAINEFLQQIARELSRGRGAVILRGLPRETYSDDELTRIYWGLATHLGNAMPQNSAGTLMIDHVRDTEGPNPFARRQYGTAELILHNDGITGENLSLLSLQKSKSGGESRVASALTIHNAFVANHPDLLEVLYEGFYFHRKGMQPHGQPLVSPFKSPVFSKIDGLVSVHYIRDRMIMAAEEMGIELPEKLKAAMDYFDSVANSPDVNVRFTLEPGEILIINNRAVLHARTEFQDYEELERKRHLVRLWMDVPNGRPYKPEMDVLHFDDPNFVAPVFEAQKH